MSEYLPLGFARRRREDCEPASYVPLGFSHRVRGVRNTGVRGSRNITGNAGTDNRKEDDLDTLLARGFAELGMQKETARKLNYENDEKISPEDENRVKDGIGIQTASEDKPPVIGITLIDSVVNSGNTIADLLQRIHTISPVHIVIVTEVLQKECIVERGNVRDLGKNGNVSVVTLRLSENKGTEEGATDTGNRPLNTADMLDRAKREAKETTPEHLIATADSSSLSAVSSSELSDGSTAI